MNATQIVLLVLIAFNMLCMLACIFLTAWMFRHWIKAVVSGVPLSVFTILGMRLRGNPAGLLIDAMIQLSHEGVNYSQPEVEKLYMRSKSRVRTSRDLVELVKQQMENQTSAPEVAT